MTRRKGRSSTSWSDGRGLGVWNACGILAPTSTCSPQHILTPTPFAVCNTSSRQAPGLDKWRNTHHPVTSSSDKRLPPHFQTRSRAGSEIKLRAIQNVSLVEQHRSNQSGHAGRDKMECHRTRDGDQAHGGFTRERRGMVDFPGKGLM